MLVGSRVETKISLRLGFFLYARTEQAIIGILHNSLQI